MLASTQYINTFLLQRVTPRKEGLHIACTPCSATGHNTASKEACAGTQHTFNHTDTQNTTCDKRLPTENYQEKLAAECASASNGVLRL